MRKTDSTHPNTVPQEVIIRARSYIGSPYVANSLVGAHNREEKLITTRTSFDCVTFIECVLAECLSKNRDTAFEDELRKLRYRHGVVSWLSRLHYLSSWLKYHEERAILKEIFPPANLITRKLALIPHYPVVECALNFIPINKLKDNLGILKSGDIIAFGSTKEDLDVSHVGFLDTGSNGAPSLIHATKQLQSVVEEPLETFISRFGSTPGILAYRVIAT